MASSGAAPLFANSRTVESASVGTRFSRVRAPELERQPRGAPCQRLHGAYIQDDPTSAKIVDAACERGQSCVIRARVERRDSPNGMPQSYTVLKVYSARKEPRT
jgi:hypothetical protein